MRTFILRCRKANANAYKFEENIGAGAYLEIAAQCLGNALFFSKNIREDVRVHIVFESGPESPKTLSFFSSNLFYMGGFHEDALLETIKKGLKAEFKQPDDLDFSTDSPGTPIEDGFYVKRVSFEKLIRYYSEKGPIYYLSPKGDDIRDVNMDGDECFVFTDHISMARKSEKFLKRMGVKKLSLGPKMLFASQCVVIINNHIDRCEIG